MVRISTVTGLDIGTSSIKILVVEKINGDLRVVAKAESPSFGLRKGVVVNVEETSKNILSVVSEVEKIHSKPIKSVFTNIQGSHLYIIPSHGLISVSRADQKISQEDIDRVLRATQAINLPSNYEILDVIPQSFIVDGQKGIKEPLGLTGIRLEAKVLLLVSFSPSLKNLTQSVLNSSLQIEDLIPSALASARAVLTPQQKEIGVALVDIGAATTSLAVFEEKELIHFAVFPIGSTNITNDLAIGLRTEIETAEKIKKQFGTCLLDKEKKEKKSKKGKKIEIFENSTRYLFSQEMLVGIIKARVLEIFNLIKKELKKISRQELLPAGVVLTGGGAKLSKLVELAKEELKLPCRIGICQEIDGLEEDSSLSTVAGLCLGGLETKLEESIFRKFFSEFKRIFKIFIP